MKANISHTCGVAKEEMASFPPEEIDAMYDGMWTEFKRLRISHGDGDGKAMFDGILQCHGEGRSSSASLFQGARDGDT